VDASANVMYGCYIENAEVGAAAALNSGESSEKGKKQKC
jgi:hypothetical protein